MRLDCSLLIYDIFLTATDLISKDTILLYSALTVTTSHSSALLAPS